MVKLAYQLTLKRLHIGPISFLGSLMARISDEESVRLAEGWLTHSVTCSDRTHERERRLWMSKGDKRLYRLCRPRIVCSNGTCPRVDKRTD